MQLWFFWLLHGPARVIETMASFEATKNYTNFLYENIANLPIQWHRDNHSGYTINQMKKSIDALENFSRESFGYVKLIIKLIGSFTVIVWIFPFSAFAALIFTVFIFFGTIWFNKRIIDLTKKMNSQNHSIMGKLFDYISNISTVITLNIQKLTQL